MRPSKIYPFSIPANGSVPLLVSGDYFKIQSSTGALNITGDTFGTLDNVLAGQGLRDTNFQRLTLTDRTGAVNNGFLLVSDSTFIDDRITGEVSVIDGGIARTISNTAFLCGVGFQPATATNNAGIMLWNNATAGGRNLIVEQLSLASSLGTQVFARLHNVALTTLVNAAISKKANGANSTIAQLKTQEGTVWSGSQILSFSSSSSGTSFFTPKEPIILPPQWGLVIHDNLVAAHQLYVNFEHYELQP